MGGCCLPHGVRFSANAKRQGLNLLKDQSSAWFAGPKSENGDAFRGVIGRILDDYYYWRRNYFPEDGIVVDSRMRRENEAFDDEFNDRLLELLGKLKADVPFHSPRYAAHMLSEQTLPSIAGYFAAMLYNPNNVSAEAASVTVRLELEASQMIARMVGYGRDCWAHLTSGGTVANIEALWMARTVKYLPFVVREMGGLSGVSDQQLLHMSPSHALSSFEKVFSSYVNAEEAIEAYRNSKYNVVEQGLSRVTRLIGSDPVLLIPETHHYSFPKLMDVLGLGRKSLVPVRVDCDLRMDVSDLATKLDDVERAGTHVLAVVTVVGTTEEGAIDPVNEILDLRIRREADKKPSFWLHADAAWGGYLRTMTMPTRLGLGKPETEVMVNGKARTIALQLPEHSACDALERLGECDSVTVDPHKLGYIPYPAGAICFKSDLIKPLARQDAPYLADPPRGTQSERASEAIGVYILEGSKPGAAAAAVWLSHKLIPLESTAHGRLVQESVRNASEMYALLLGWPELAGESSVRAVPLCQPGSNVVCYAFRRATGTTSLDEINNLNENLYRRFSFEASQKSIYAHQFFVSHTVLSPRTHDARSIGTFLRQLGVCEGEYLNSKVFLFRSVLMNPWYGHAKRKGHYFISDLVQALYKEAAALCP